MDSSFAIPSKGSIGSDGKPVQIITNSSASKPSELPNAIDLSHHLTELSKHRAASSLKELYRYMAVPHMITMAGGVPSPELYPFETISASLLTHDAFPLDYPRVPQKPKKSFFSWLFPSFKPTTDISIPKYVESADASTIQLSTYLQYQPATGLPAVPLFLRKYVELVYQPAYADWDVLLNCGATDAWNKVVLMLVEKGDPILVEEWTYPGASNSYSPLETVKIALKMDGEGIIPDYMDKLLGNWDETARGMKRPHVLYTVPTGQNPTGATMGADRKKAIYDLCCKYDVIICEDEPYYCLFTGKWTPKKLAAEKSIMAQRTEQAEKQDGKEGNEAFLKALPPSFLKFDTQGRVIRMDTFSKTSCPGSRLGWITTSPLFIERLTRATEGSSQSPSGFATALTGKMLSEWGMEGYIRWLRGIKAMYKMRRDWMCDAFENVFHLEIDDAPNGVKTNDVVFDIFDGTARGVTCYAKPTDDTAAGRWDEKKGFSSKHGLPLVSFIPPTAGMFIFLAIHMEGHPDYKALLQKGENAVEVLMTKLWLELAENLVLFAPATSFDANGVHGIGGEGIGYFRLSYSIATYEETNRAISTFAKILTKFFRA
ncbi:hypothetical protein TREMEDRAFT_71644 [Tremella mesenterica DSM 1558]|uniref:uncharacterized protein n=1 Tax=Tremella mesenterica (strain ATCC 24925 / CBS 8224 / DSM 1558 / NBRC 9311 / NRRL Y-6157 / RJB 2259-6 / UBC 559-6) TaxID=578456 RepID=UPI0003F4A3C9|nr:uncharacterized protein TREMEDRAFT_71644 [Tremella mesenterica DSM 1558]EIW69475.1 hypothetical protein TREMEDRAFT_71644 [Tremella mesenterica DSM 1558]